MDSDTFLDQPAVSFSICLLHLFSLITQIICVHKKFKHPIVVFI